MGLAVAEAPGRFRRWLVLLLTAGLFSLPLLANVVLANALGIYVFYLNDPVWQGACATAVLLGPGLGFWHRLRAEGGAAAAPRQALVAALAYLAYGAGVYSAFVAPRRLPGAYFELAALTLTALILLRTVQAWREGRQRDSGPALPDR